MIRGQQWCVFSPSRSLKVSTFLALLSIVPKTAIAADLPKNNDKLPAVEERAQAYYGGWKKPKFSANFEGVTFSEGKNEENLVRLDLDVETAFEPTTWFRFQLTPRLTMNNGRIQRRYDIEAAQSSRLNLRDTYVSFHTEVDQWLENLEFRVGSHWQRYLHSSMLVSGRRSFIGAQQRATVRFSDEVKTRFVAQQVIPDSSSDDGEREDREKTPLFTTETFAIQWKRDGVADVEPFITHYKFSNLPAIVAANSAVIGNTVDGEVGPDSRFRYGFNGFMAGVDSGVHLSEKIRFEIYAYQIQNNDAPAGARRGQWVQVALPVEVSDNFYFRPVYARYFLESDVVPGAYNSGTLGHNNRKGQRVGIDFGFKKLGFEIETRYIQADVINYSPDQAKLYSFYIGLAIGTPYDVQ